MIKVTKQIKYKYDTFGTEEVLLNDGCSPILDIDYNGTLKENQQFAYRPTPEDVNTGIAQIEGVKGNTVVWNQYSYYCKNNITGIIKEVMVKNHFRTWFIKGSTTRLFISLRPLEADLSVLSNHVCYICYDVKTNINKGFGLGLITGSSYNKRLDLYRRFTYIPGRLLSNNFIATNNSVRFNKGDYVDGYQLIIDLTRIYGAGNEPTTPEQFEADYFKWFGKPLGYEEDNAGVLLPTMIDGLKSTGFNQYNPESGLIKAIVGQQHQITGTFSKVWESEEESPVFTEYTYGSIVEGAKYYSVGGSHYEAKGAVFEYDNESIWETETYCFHENQVYKCNTAIDTAEEWDATHWDLIADVATMVTEGIFVPMDITPDSNGIFTPTKFYLHVEGGNATDTCVHLVGDGARNGEYEQYQEHNVSIPVTTLTGKLNGEGESVVVFPDGMKRAGSVCDEIVIKNGKAVAIKRVGSVDLGSLTWDYSSENFSATISNRAFKKDNIFSFAKYPLRGYVGNRSAANVDKNAYWYYATNYTSRSFYIVDSAYSDSETFKTAMNGVMLYYELRTPQEYELDNSPIKSINFGNQDISKVYSGNNLVFEQLNYYGVRWEYDPETNTNSDVLERIGRMDWHQSLPIQSQMKRCILKEDGTINYVSDDWQYDTNGNLIDYTAEGQDVMVEIPEHYYVTGTTVEDGKTWRFIKLYPYNKIGRKVPKHYIGAFEAMVNRTTDSLYSTCKTNIVYNQDGEVDFSDLTYTDDAATYRGGDNNHTTYADDSTKTQLGKPATYITISNFCNYASKRGEGYMLEHWASRSAINRLFIVEYASFDSEAEFNSELTEDGFHQGGLGEGATTIPSSSNWNSYNGYRPLVPCGITLKLANNSGIVRYNLPTAIEGITYFDIPSYRGIENIFGHVWENVNGLLAVGSGFTNTIYTLDKNNNWNLPTFKPSSASQGQIKITNSIVEGWITDWSWDRDGDFVPTILGKTQTESNDPANSPLRDYSWQTNTGTKRLLVGGSCSNPARSGLFAFNVLNPVSIRHASFGSRLLKI